jgi:hypothetical protein
MNVPVHRAVMVLDRLNTTRNLWTGPQQPTEHP